MVVLKRLPEAEADGDRIWGVIRGSAVNQNGASAGPTVPNGLAQEQVIEQALLQACIDPSEVDYLEAHGAGSAFGDSIEVQAAANIYGRGRAEGRPLLIGSVKTNIGHLESAAGIAGLIKAVLAMQRRVIPPHLNFHEPSPLVEWDQLPVQVPISTTGWPATPDRPPRASVSAFGISGVNAHVVLEGHGADSGRDGEEPWSPKGSALSVRTDLPEGVGELAETREADGLRGARLLPLSAKSSEALQSLAARYLAWLDETGRALGPDLEASDPRLSDMAWTAGVGRSHLACRAGMVFRDVASLRQQLTTVAAANHDMKPASVAKVAFAYSDEIGRWMDLSEDLYESEPVARRVLDRCEEVLREEREMSLLDSIFDRPGSDGTLEQPAWREPALYALACALTALWSSVGIRPSVVGGQGVGEIAAAQAAGVFGLEDGLRLAATRGVLLGRRSNGATAPDAGDELKSVLEGTMLAAPSISLVNSLTGRLVEPGKELDAAYWDQQFRARSPIERCAGTLAELEVRLIIEIGSEAALGPKLAREWPVSTTDLGTPTLLPSVLSASANGTRHFDTGFLQAVGGAYEAGLPVSFAGLFAGEQRRRISLPDYPFQRQRFWLQKDSG